MQTETWRVHQLTQITISQLHASSEHSWNSLQRKWIISYTFPAVSRKSQATKEPSHSTTTGTWLKKQCPHFQHTKNDADQFSRTWTHKQCHIATVLQRTCHAKEGKMWNSNGNCVLTSCVLPATIIASKKSLLHYIHVCKESILDGTNHVGWAQWAWASK
jgi:hypothetical protein